MGKIILAASFIVTMVIGLEAANRKIAVNKDGLTNKKFFREKSLVWMEVTHLGVVELLNKAYFLLNNHKGILFFFPTCMKTTLYLFV